MVEQTSSEDSKLEKIAANVPGVIYQFLLRPDGSSCFPYASKGIADVYGVTPEEVVEDATPVFNVLHPDDFDEVARSIYASAEAMTTWHAEYRVNHPDKGVIWLYGHSEPERLDDGSILWHGYITEITEQKRIVSELRAEKARLRAMLEAEPECVKTVDADCRLIDMNRAGLRKIGAPCLNNVRGADLLDIVAPEYHDQFRAGVDAVFRGESVLQEFEIVSLTGTRHWMQQSSAPLYEAEDPTKVTAMIAVTRDVTEQRIAARELETAKLAAEAAKDSMSRFVANVSHEIRTPLNSVIALAGALERDGLSDKHAEMVRVIRESGDSLMGLLNDVLDLSKVEADRTELDCAAFHLTDVLRKIETLYAVRAQEAGVNFSVECACDLGACSRRIGDAAKLQQVLHNVIANALKFTSDGSVRVVCRAPQDVDVVEFRVADTGVGIAPEQLDRIFERFSQADESTTRTYGGSGLGLAISKALVELMGGTITVESRLGEGSTFTVRVPLPLAEDAREAPAPADIEHAGLQGLRILAADDNPANRLVLETLLGPAGADVTLAESGEDAVAAYAPGRFDVVVLDIQMPGLDGFGALSRLRAADHAAGAPETPVLAVTAGVMTHEVADYRARGFDGLVAKPISAAALYAEIARVVETGGEKARKAG